MTLLYSLVEGRTIDGVHKSHCSFLAYVIKLPLLLQFATRASKRRFEYRPLTKASVTAFILHKTVLVILQDVVLYIMVH